MNWIKDGLLENLHGAEGFYVFFFRGQNIVIVKVETAKPRDAAQVLQFVFQTTHTRKTKSQTANKD